MALLADQEMPSDMMPYTGTPVSNVFATSATGIPSSNVCWSTTGIPSSNVCWSTTGIPSSNVCWSTTEEHVNEIHRKNACLLKCGQWMATVGNQASRFDMLGTMTESTKTTSTPTCMQSRVDTLIAGTTTRPPVPRSVFGAPSVSDKQSRKSRSGKSYRSSSSRMSRTSAKAKLQKARLRLERLDEKKELERKLEELKLRTEVEEAEIDARIANEMDSSGEESQNESLGLPIQGHGERIYKFLEERSQQFSDQSFAEFPDSFQDKQSTKLVLQDDKVDDVRDFVKSDTYNTPIDNNEQLTGAQVNDDQVKDDKLEVKDSKVTANVDEARYEVKNSHVSNATYVNGAKPKVKDLTGASAELDNEVKNAETLVPTNVNDVNESIDRHQSCDAEIKDDVKPNVNDAYVSGKRDNFSDDVQHKDASPKVNVRVPESKDAAYDQHENVMSGVNVQRMPRDDDVQSKRSDEVNDARVFSNGTTWETPQDRENESKFVDVSNASSVFNVLQRQQETMDEVVRTLSMPKRGYMSFDGDPLTFPLFIKNFEINIERRETHDSDRLSYLIQFCKGKARDAIEHCIMMSPSEGYAKAKDILKRNFGRSHVVSKAFLDKVVKGPTIKITESERLSQLSRDMETCMLGSSELGLESSLNSLDTLGKIVNRLPLTLKSRWAEKASQIYEQGMTPKFSHLANFIEQRATVANTYFGQLVQENRPDKDVKQRPRFHAVPTVKATTLATTSNKERSEESALQSASWRVRCPLCDGEHYLDQCKRFREKTAKQRMDVTSEKELCRSCLKKGHIVKDCRKTRMCNEGGCKGKHHPLLHAAIVQQQHQRIQPNASVDQATSSRKATAKTDGGSTTKKPPSTDHLEGANVARNNAIRTDLRHVSLKVVPVRVKALDSDREIETYAFLDDGSDTTMCLQSLADDLGIEGKPIQFVLSTMSGDQQRSGRQLSLDVTGVSTGKGVRLQNVWTTDHLPITEENVITRQDVCDMDHLKDVEFAELTEKKITLLIGSDTPEALCPLEVRSGRKGEPYGLRTLLGWTVTGPLKKDGKQRAIMNFIHVDQSIGCDESEPVLTQIHDEFVRLYNSEFSENTAEVRECLSVENQRAKRIMNQTVKFVNGHYQVGLPWKYDRPQLPDNKLMAEKRLMLLKKRLLRDTKLLEKYKDTMEQYISRGHAVRVQEGEKEDDNQQTIPMWYLPHHPVAHPQKPEKVRVVYDCAASYNGTSLNEQLLQGPDNTNSLVGVLLRFRKEPVALMSDIEQMFHQVYVEPSDRNALRFLWWPEGDLETQPVDYKMNVHLFGATSSPSVCSYALRKVAEYGKNDYSAQTIETINSSFYVDDCLKSVASVDEAIPLVKELTSLLAKRGFRLTKWVSNRREVLSEVPSVERAKSISLDLEKLPVERALGVQWDVERDTLGFRQGKETSNTRRGILSFVASIYDPLGLVAPYILPAKMMLQHLCRIKHDWDASLPIECQGKWTEIKKGVEKLKEVHIPRCYKPLNLKEIQKIELHHFADASAEGYGTASYIRLIDIENNVHCALIMGKSRVAPLKTVTIPRLELTAATLAVKIDKQIRQELQLPVHRVVFWTDSAIVIGYVRNETKRFQTFVANRLQVIHDASSPQQWRHVPTESNPADLSSRGVQFGDEKELYRWINGPEFLREREESWPSLPDNMQEIGDDDAEVKGSKAQIYAQVQITKDIKNEGTSLSELLNRWSSWYRLCKMIAWLLRFKQYLKWCRDKEGNDKVSSGPLSVPEVSQAEMKVVKLVQREAFPSAQIKTSSEHGAKVVYSRLQNLSPIAEDGVMRVGGRLTNAPLDEANKHPAILPSNHHVTSMIVRHYHQQNGHVGCNQTLAAVRKRFWIIKGPSTVRRILKSCVPCRRRSQQAPTQFMAPLPKARVTPGEHPFSSTGVDYFGPLNVKYRRGTTKRYGCIFTCLSSRAVHIEVSSDLTTDSFIQAVCRFVSRRGPPRELYSDNGSNFRGAESEIKKALIRWNQERIRERLREREIEWHFNAPSASHTGGVWERMIRTTRRILRATVGSQLLDDETLSTALCEVEKIINDRPLTPISSDPKDMEALTPSSLLLLRPNPSVKPCPDLENSKMKGRWKLAQSVADSFWKRWIAEYLPTLQERQKWLKKQKNLSKGDLVMIKDDSIQRGQWPLGLITETHPDAQGTVRRVLVRTAKGTYERDIRKLSLLERHED